MEKKQWVNLGIAFALTLFNFTSATAATTSSSEKISLNSETGAPVFIAGTLTVPSQADPYEIVLSYLREKENLYSIKLEGAQTLDIISETTDELGFTNIKLQHMYNGVPVFGSVLSAHINQSGVLTAISGELTQISKLDQDPAEENAFLQPSSAAAAVTNDLTAKLKKAPDIIQQESPSLVVFVGDGEARLAYSSEVEYLEPEPGNVRYFIDAANGAILASFNQIHQADPVGKDAVSAGTGLLGDKKSIYTVQNAEGSFLLDRTRGKGILTYDAANMLELPGKLWQDADGLFNEAYDAAAVDAHVYAGQTFDYFKKIHGRTSYDGKGARVISTVHYGEKYNNAFWSGSQMVYGDGDGTTFSPLSGSLDVVAHELTHAVTATTAKLIYQGQSGAINESISDVYGALVEGYFDDHPDWLIGEDIYTPKQKGDALRSLADPTTKGQPDHYSKLYLGTEDYGGVHINSGIGNKAAYLLANGGTHYSVAVKGIGLDKTGKILYRTLTQYLTPNTSYRQYQAAAVQAATDLYGASSEEVNSVKAAFSAVGLQ
ncbi:M4 family metallopeptidase [Planomicrobium sp. CPCC 101079]|uniref:M4 family metallopeptidase n=1 Tax=Planomicrobium sp. CPCC 101079 TaxID=2599618 RepID=UPI0011B76334|nr:M4 family metallopeptidase [Planomicrobium sp. CPCC 101079]TWT00963.1 peptidase M4 family protein [Planomicrobium sp. CPCC 101079]